MATSTTCIYEGEEITIEQALNIRGNQKLPEGTFECTECFLPVRPHNEGGHTPAHFEHCARNANCSLSHPFNQRSYIQPELYDIEDPKAIEGYETDRKILAKNRNAGLTKKCKERDDYTCKACGYKLQINGRYIAECHHTIMISDGEREVSLNELITLCPTCHRIAHTRSEPYSLDELIEIVKKP
jgi:hypothetical protein